MRISERQPASPRGSGGFSLIELLVVISIMIVLAGMLWPVVGVIERATGTASASGTVAVAVETARYVNDERAAADKPVPTNGQTGETVDIPWSGSAALFTASGEIRLLECDQGVNILPRHAYRDAPGRDYITLPSPRGVMGIGRDSSGLKLYAPPFAVRFNKAGQLVAGTTLDDYVYYNGNYDSTFSINGRPGNYVMPTKDKLKNPNAQAGNEPEYYVGGGGTSGVTHFEQIVTVIGVVLFDPSDVGLGTKPIPDMSASSTIGKAILSKGHVLMFNRYTGTPFRKLNNG